VSTVPVPAARDDARRRIPATERLLGSAAFAPLLTAWPRPRVVAALQAVQAVVRVELERGGPPPPWLEESEAYAGRVALRLEREHVPSLRRVINATGVVLHTNLGRAPLAEPAIAAVAGVAGGYTSLEYDLTTGERGSRYDHCAALLAELTGAEAALVVNNNAAAVLVSLNSLAEGREVVVSRGELVEIGGGFRIHEIAAKSGARLREVGSTNRTHLADYEQAIGPAAGALLKVHRANFRQEGFVAEVPAGALARLAAAHGLPLIHDLGSGLLVSAAHLGLDDPTADCAVAAGARVVTMSGDKLLGGPQAGILLGAAAEIEQIRRNPLSRALRVDRMTLAALEATLRIYRAGDASAWQAIPALRALAATEAELLDRARSWADALVAAGYDVEVVRAEAPAGGGAAPASRLAGAAVAVRYGDLSAEALAARLRAGEPPVVARIGGGRLLLDPRAVAPDEGSALLDALRRATG
jgi:L-seryl-tRNA(Ser) seleniumtransferase